MIQISVELAEELSAKSAAPSQRAHLDIVVERRSPSPRPSPPRLIITHKSAAFAGPKARSHTSLGQRPRYRARHPQGLKARSSERSSPEFDRAFSPPIFMVSITWAVGPGWHDPRRWRSGGGATELVRNDKPLRRGSPSIPGKMGRAFSPESDAVSFPGAWPQAGMSPRPWRSTNK